MVVPSLEEAFGKTVIEAMACRTPVVAFNTGGPRDIIEHKLSGYLAEERSAESLAQGILWVLDEPARLEQLSARALQRVQNNYDISLIATRYIDLYRKSLSITK